MTDRLPSDKTTQLLPHVVQQILTSSQEDRFLADLLDALPVGVIVMDTAGRVVRYNLHEQRLAQRSAESVLGKLFFREVAPCTAVSSLLPAFEQYSKQGGELQVDLHFQFPFPHLKSPRDVRLRLRGFDSGNRRFAFLLVEDITEEMQARRLRELLAMLVAHDMKNPLTAIRLNVDMVLRELRKGPTADSVSERLGDARIAAERLDRMIRLFLDVYRLENAELPVSFAPVDPEQLVQELVRSQAPLAEAYGLELRSEGNAPSLSSDATLLLRIIENLLDNAMRHARTSIQLLLRGDDEVVEFEVIDDGQGVPDEAKELIFDKFASLSADLRGYNQGLGLTFCKLAVDRLGGTLSVLDASPRGALFRLRLPRHHPG
ncbi:MAG: ATP-binding protein [Myxococcales bacterium]|nr:PAS domain-containing sensor histidine kinase [Polyangiaceae bacterium]MDW8251569.1 ATP-binding protein [Myxococcales bacterium]